MPHVPHKHFRNYLSCSAVRLNAYSTASAYSHPKLPRNRRTPNSTNCTYVGGVQRTFENFPPTIRKFRVRLFFATWREGPYNRGSNMKFSARIHDEADGPSSPSLSPFVFFKKRYRVRQRVQKLRNTHTILWTRAVRYPRWLCRETLIEGIVTAGSLRPSLCPSSLLRS